MVVVVIIEFDDEIVPLVCGIGVETGVLTGVQGEDDEGFWRWSGVATAEDDPVIVFINRILTLIVSDFV